MAKVISFQPVMVRAILDFRKTETRRKVPHFWKRSPYHDLKPGDILWVRENFTVPAEFNHLTPKQLPIDCPVRYAADGPGFPFAKPRPGRHMPHRFSRLRIRCKYRTLEPLWAMGSDAVQREGFIKLSKDGGRTWKWGLPDRDGLPGNDDFGWHWERWKVLPLEAYADLWDEINGPGDWAQNPEVACISFEVARLAYPPGTRAAT